MDFNKNSYKLCLDSIFFKGPTKKRHRMFCVSLNVTWLWDENM